MDLRPLTLGLYLHSQMNGTSTHGALFRAPPVPYLAGLPQVTPPFAILTFVRQAYLDTHSLAFILFTGTSVEQSQAAKVAASSPLVHFCIIQFMSVVLYPPPNSLSHIIHAYITIENIHRCFFWVACSLKARLHPNDGAMPFRVRAVLVEEHNFLGTRCHGHGGRVLVRTTGCRWATRLVLVWLKLDDGLIERMGTRAYLKVTIYLKSQTKVRPTKNCQLLPVADRTSGTPIT